MSLPCENCISRMQLMANKKNYRIQNILYSDEQGEIISISLNKLEKTIQKHRSRYYRIQERTNTNNV